MNMMVAVMLSGAGLTAFAAAEPVKDGNPAGANATDAAAVAEMKAIGKVWPSTPPADCPFPKSDVFSGIAFTGRFWHKGGDGWRLTWAQDGRIFACWQDGEVNGVSASGTVSTGFSELEGDGPLHFKVKSASIIPLKPAPHRGQYLCGLLAHNGVLYYGTYGLDEKRTQWDIMGPLIGFHVSKDFGKTWQEIRRPDNPLFGETSLVQDGKTGADRSWAKVKIGASYFVDFGKNMEHSPDGKAYLVAQGSTRPEAYNSWAGADQAYLFRVTPSPETINDPKAYEFFAGYDASGGPQWTKDFSQIRPLAEWNNHMGTVGITYISQLKRYFMCVSDGHGGKVDGNDPYGPEAVRVYQERVGRGSNVDGNGPYDTYILESAHVTGPWKLVTYMEQFGPQGYFANFLSQYASADGRTVWLCYGANWEWQPNKDPLKNNPSGSEYGMNLQELRLLTPGEVKKP